MQGVAQNTESGGYSVVFDIEASGLLDDSTVDYSASPFKLRDSFKLHCLACTVLETGETFDFVQGDIPRFINEVLPRCTKLINHNLLGYDLMALKAVFGVQYELADPTDPSSVDKVNGKPCQIVDTLVMSKTLRPARYR